MRDEMKDQHRQNSLTLQAGNNKLEGRSGKPAQAVKKILGLLLVALLLVPALHTTVSAEADPVKVGYFLYDGYQNKSADGTYSGYGYDYLQQIAVYADVQLEFVEGTWAQCLQWLQDGSIDTMGFMYKTEEREQLFDFPDWNCGYNSAKLLTLATNTTLPADGWEDYDGICVGFVENSPLHTNYTEKAKVYGISYSEKYYESTADATVALLEGEVDAICVGSEVVSSRTRVLANMDPQPIYYAISKGNTELLNAFNRAIGQIKTTTPTYEEALRSKYYADDSSKTVVFSSAEKRYIASADTLVVALSPDLPPIESIAPDTGEPTGFTVSLLTQIAEMSGLRFSYVCDDSQSETLEHFQKNDYDFLSGINASAANSLDCTLTDTFLSASYVLIGKDSFVSSANAGIVIAVTPRDQFLKSYIQVLYPNSTFVECDSSAVALELVAASEVDLAVRNIYSAQAQLMDYPHLRIITDTGRFAKYHFALPNDAPEELVSILNKCIQAIPASESNAMLTAALLDNVPDSSGRTVLLIVLSVILAFFAVYLINRLHKSRKKLVRTAYYDKITGESNYEKFIMDAELLVKKNPQLLYAIRVIDVSRFQMFNDFYGFEAGNVLLRKIAEVWHEMQGDRIGTFGRTGADKFVALSAVESEQDFEEQLQCFRTKFEEYENPVYRNVVFKTGYCIF